MEIKKKIFNDPLYGLISFPFESVYKIIDHKYFQRLRRISQLGLSSYVYTGASHSRFHHSIGVAHLADAVIDVLRLKLVDITPEEHEAVVLAALLHDVGHGPFSHVLERAILNEHHESLSLQIMHLLNAEFEGMLDQAILVFTNAHPKKFLHQIISGQIDVDRLDYLTRDSFYTGVVEGRVGYNRILKMMDVHDNRLVVEEKGMYSVEKFLMARRFMYMQVYLHKVVVILDVMLNSFLERYRDCCNANKIVSRNRLTEILDITLGERNADLLEDFLKIDDIDIFQLIKDEAEGEDKILSLLAQSILNRRLFSIEFSDFPKPSDFIIDMRQKVAQTLNIDVSDTKYFVRSGTIDNLTYSRKDEIEIKTKRKAIKPISFFVKSLEFNFSERSEYVCFARN